MKNPYGEMESKMIEDDERKAKRDEARRMYRALETEIWDLYQTTVPDDWAYVDSIQALHGFSRHMTAQRDEARRYARRYYLRYLNELKNFDTAWRRVMDAERERDEARKRTEFLEAVNDLSLGTTKRAQDLAGRLLKFAGRLIIERDDARARLRQLLHALDNQSDGDGNAHLSWNVRAQMRQARRLLKEGDRED